MLGNLVLVLAAMSGIHRPDEEVNEEETVIVDILIVPKT